MARPVRAKVSGSRAGKRATAEAVLLADGWSIRRAGDLHVLESPALSRLAWLTHGFSLRPGGDSVLRGARALNLGFTEWDKKHAVEANRAKFSGALAASAESGWRWITLRQVHSDLIHVLDAAPETVCQGDALATKSRRLLLGMQAADCVPILLADARRRGVAAIHAGWRGTLARIAAKTLGRMRMEFGTQPRDVAAAIGPAIGRCCYEVGPDVAQTFAAQFPAAAEWFDGPFEQLAHGEEPLWLPWLTMMPPGHVPPPPRVRLDLHAANRWQLVAGGVPESQIDVSELCTSCRTDLLFSHRREHGNTGRMIAAIGVR